MRTFTRADLDASRAAWDAGEFSAEWRDVRHLAAMGGIIYPPEGTKWDSWEDDNPTQRAILIRAIRESPRLLEKCIPGARSWSQVIERLLRARDDWRARLDLDAREAAWDSEAPTHRESVMALGSILERIDASR